MDRLSSLNIRGEGSVRRRHYSEGARRCVDTGNRGQPVPACSGSPSGRLEPSLPPHLGHRTPSSPGRSLLRSWAEHVSRFEEHRQGDPLAFRRAPQSHSSTIPASLSFRDRGRRAGRHSSNTKDASSWGSSACGCWDSATASAAVGRRSRCGSGSRRQGSTRHQRVGRVGRWSACHSDPRMGTVRAIVKRRGGSGSDPRRPLPGSTRRQIGHLSAGAPFPEAPTGRECSPCG